MTSSLPPPARAASVFCFLRVLSQPRLSPGNNNTKSCVRAPALSLGGKAAGLGVCVQRLETVSKTLQAKSPILI